MKWEENKTDIQSLQKLNQKVVARVCVQAT